MNSKENIDNNNNENDNEIENDVEFNSMKNVKSPMEIDSKQLLKENDETPLKKKHVRGLKIFGFTLMILGVYFGKIYGTLIYFKF